MATEKKIPAIEEKEKVKPIILKMEDGEEFTLEFSRESIRFAEARGFDIDEVAKYPMTRVPELFWYAFRMHHPRISKEQAERILIDDMGGMPKGMAERLGQLYAAPFEALSQDDEGEGKNCKVTVEM